MRSKLFARLVFGFCGAAVFLTTTASAYVLRTDESGVYVIKWHSSPVVMQIKLPSTANLLDGNSQASSVVAGMQAWNYYLGTLQFSPTTSVPGAYKNGNEINEVVMDSTIDGEAFAAGTLAVTMIYRRANNIDEADIVFNSTYAWDSYRGDLRRGVEDIQRVVMHELGHVLGLKHPDEAGQIVGALMNSHESNDYAPRQDDIQGAQMLYGAPGAKPINDSFSAATVVDVTTRTGRASGSNVGADREPGEPSPAASTGAHSVWWKLTAPVDGRAMVTTLGSNFDTVLGAYSGSSISTLVLLADNDDIETPVENATPQRLRTSTVTFDISAGSTYYILVDGWGSVASTSTGYTGSIELYVYISPLSGPGFDVQPVSQTTTAGQSVVFEVRGTGIPTPTYRWERHPVGGDWVPLTDGRGYSGTATSSLTVVTSVNMDGDLLRCMATNSRGVDTSWWATLRVNPAADPNAPSGRLVNLSVRSRAGTNDKTLIMGFVIAGAGPKQVLVRGLGPLLRNYGVNGALANPELKVFSGATQVDGNNDWNPALAPAFAAVGAAGLTAGSKDAALLRDGTSGVFSAHVTSVDGSVGVALAEVYDVDKIGARLVNVSARSEVRTGEDILVAGFVLEGPGSKTLLIRGLGPTLAALGVAGALSDPQLKLYNQAGVQLAENGDWFGAIALKSAFATVGAAPLTSDRSKDAALLVTLQPGVYSVQVSGVNNTTGVALVEIYEVP
jgi:hypothetical protein